MHEIHASPDVDIAVKGGGITYTMAGGDERGSGAPRFIWVAVYQSGDKRAPKEEYFLKKSGFSRGADIRQDKTIKWKYTGKHELFCTVKFPGSRPPRTASTHQKVQDAQDLLNTALIQSSREGKPPDPWRAHQVIDAYIVTLKDLEKRHPTKDQARHRSRLKELEDYRDALVKVIRKFGSGSMILHPIFAAHVNTVTHETSLLNVCVVEDISAGGKSKLAILDWTRPDSAKHTKLFEGEGSTDRKALEEAIEEWKDDNQYFPGELKCAVMFPAPGGPFSKKFHTGEKSTFQTIAEWLGYTAQAVGVAGLVLSFVIPGAGIVTGMIWTALLSGAASAVLSTADRHMRDRNSLQADIFDGLTILSSMFGGAVLWKQGRSVIAQLPGSPSIEKYLFVGSLVTDGFQGVLVTARTYEDIRKMMENVDRDLTPDERYRQGVEMTRQAIQDFALTVVGLRSTWKDLKGSLARNGIDIQAIDKSQFETLLDPDAQPLDLTKPVEHTADTSKPVKKIQTRRDPPIHDGEGSGGNRPPKKQRGPPPVGKSKGTKGRGMLSKHDKKYANRAKKDGLVILVIDSSKYALKWMHRDSVKIGGTTYKCKPKPEPVKAKTGKSGPEELKGLSALDPKDPKLDQYLGSVGSSYQLEKQKLTKAGYEVRGEEHGFLVVHPGRKEVYFSDHDLHGVYHAESGKDAYTQAWKDSMNDELATKGGGEAAPKGQVDMIQHPPRNRWAVRQNEEKVGTAVGPATPITAYTPEGTFALRTWQDLKALHEHYNIDWDRIWGKWESNHSN